VADGYVVAKKESNISGVKGPYCLKILRQKKEAEVKMRKTPITLQELRKRIYAKAKTEPNWRFWGMYVHICKLETLKYAYKMVKKNHGSPGVDGVTFEEIEEQGVEQYLQKIRQELLQETYLPLKYREVKIPKGKGKERTLRIPSIKDRIVQGAMKLILEPIFEADFQEGSFGFRPKRKAHDAIHRVAKAITENKTKVVDLDLTEFFDNVRHHILFAKVAERINDPKVMHLLKIICKTAGKKGIPQGGVISPLLANIYLNEVDKMLEKAKEVTHNRVTYARYADDLVILINPENKLTGKVCKRLLEELNKIQVEANKDKSKIVDLKKSESFNFLGFEFRRVKSKNGKWRPDYRPNRKARKKLMNKLKYEFRHNRSQAVKILVEIINPILRGWINYFRIGNSSDCFGYIRLHVDKKLRRHMMRAKNKPGFGWKRWSRKKLVKITGIYNDYKIRYYNPKATPAR